MSISEAILNLEKLILRTPLIPLRDMHSQQPASIYMKTENLQICGAYKIRGIVSLLKNLEPEILAKGLCAASSGNMAQAIAFAAQQLKIPCTIYVPNHAPQVKILAIKALGAEVVTRDYEEIWKIVTGKIKLPEDRYFIQPALNRFLVNGYATIAQEIIEDMPEVDAVVIPFGVGGLSLGISNAMQQFNPRIAIFLAEPETAAPFKRSLRLTRAASIKRLPSFVDAIGTPEVLPAVFQQLAPMVQDSLVMPLNEVKQAIKGLYFNHKLIIEGAAGCSLAAAIRLARLGSYRKIACILSGGNIDIEVSRQLIDEKMH